MSKVPSKAYTVALVTLGCAKNEADSRAMRMSLARQGFVITESLEAADYILLNTCAFIEAAVEESLDTILELAAFERVMSGEAKLLVAGCLPSRFGEELAGELPEVSAFVPVAEESNLVETLMKLVAQDKEGFCAEVGDSAAETQSAALLALAKERLGAADAFGVAKALNTDPLPQGLLSGDEQPWAYVKISDGCSRQCSYCTIPSIRGSYHSYSFKHISAEVEELVAGGAQEIILIGQDTGIWGEPRAATTDCALVDCTTADCSPADSVSVDCARGCNCAHAKDKQGDGVRIEVNTSDGASAEAEDVECARGPQNLAQLLATLASQHPQTWFRVMYLQPEGITDELLQAMASHENIAHYLDIPLQHASKSVLKAMNRRGSGSEYLVMLERIRAVLEEVTLRTTVMTGFPGESSEDFDELCDFIAAAQFDYVGIFAYSAEDGTGAAQMQEQVPLELSLERMQELRDIADAVGFECAQKHVGTVVDVLICGCDEEGVFGRTQGQAPEVDGVTYVLPAPPVPKDGLRVELSNRRSQQEQTISEISEVETSSGSSEILLELGCVVSVRITEAILYDLFGEAQ